MKIKNLNEDRVPAEKTDEWISNYLKPSVLVKNNSIKKLYEFLYLNYNRKIVKDFKINDYSCDYYLPDINIAIKLITYIDFNETKVDKTYQLNTFLEFEKNNIHIIQIFEDIWIKKQNIVESRLNNLFGNSKQIYARKCEVIEFNTKTANICSKFIENNHIQGNVGSSFKFGLMYEGELVSVMTFGKLRKNLGQKGGPDDYELLRFCNKCGYSVVGGASKLFKYFIRNYNPLNVTSYADKMWSKSDNLYTTIGMKPIHRSAPSYFYIVGEERKNRFGYRKNVLLECGYDGTKWGEHDICYNNGLYRIFDVGCDKMMYVRDNQE